MSPVIEVCKIGKRDLGIEKIIGKNPAGEIVAGPVSEKEEILYADVDPDEIISAKRMFDVSGHYSRPDVFRFSVTRSI